MREYTLPRRDARLHSPSHGLRISFRIPVTVEHDQARRSDDCSHEHGQGPASVLTRSNDTHCSILYLRSCSTTRRQLIECIALD